MQLICIGINYKTAPLEIREKLAVNKELAAMLLPQLLAANDVAESMVLSTCNRVEVYVYAKSLTPVYKIIATQFKIELKSLRPIAYIWYGPAVARHLFRVACGLDSMVLGEAEIVGQIKNSMQIARECDSLGKYLCRLFDSSLCVAKKVRNNTEIGSNSLSIAYIGVQLVKRIFSDLDNKNALVIGAGDNSRLILQHLYSSGIRNFYLLNRNLDRAEELIKNLGFEHPIELHNLEAVDELLPKIDIVVSSTASEKFIIHQNLVQQVIKIRKHKPICMIDLAIPRDIDPRVGNFDDIYLYSLDNLQDMAKQNQQQRQDAIDKADEIVAIEVNAFVDWLNSLHTMDVLCRFRESFEDIRDISLLNAKSQLKSGADAEEVLEKMSYVIVNKFLHHPTVKIKEASQVGDISYLQAVEELFNLSKK